MSQLIQQIAYAVVILHMIMLAIAVWRIWRGENVADRLLGADLVMTLLTAILVLLSIVLRDSIYIDIAIGLATLGFITTVALAKHIADEQMF